MLGSTPASYWISTSVTDSAPTRAKVGIRSALVRLVATGRPLLGLWSEVFHPHLGLLFVAGCVEPPDQELQNRRGRDPMGPRPIVEMEDGRLQVLKLVSRDVGDPETEGGPIGGPVVLVGWHTPSVAWLGIIIQYPHLRFVGKLTPANFRIVAGVTGRRQNW